MNCIYVNVKHLSDRMELKFSDQRNELSKVNKTYVMHTQTIGKLINVSIGERKSEF